MNATGTEQAPRFAWTETRDERRRGFGACATVVAGFAAALAVSLGLNQLLSNSAQKAHAVGTHSSSSPGGADGASVTNPAGANIFGTDGTRVTLRQYSASAPSTPLPKSPLANSSNAGSVWETSGGSVAIYYPSSGIEFAVVHGTVDMKTAPAGTVHTINGVPAMILRGLREGSPPVPATVSIPLPNNRVLQLIGPSASDLVSVAKTLPIQATSSPYFSDGNGPVFWTAVGLFVLLTVLALEAARRRR